MLPYSHPLRVAIDGIDAAGKTTLANELVPYMEPSSSEEDRNDAQLEAIFRAHVANLYRYVYQQVPQGVIAEDLTSSVFLKALRFWACRSASGDTVLAWRMADCFAVRIAVSILGLVICMKQIFNLYKTQNEDIGFS